MANCPHGSEDAQEVELAPGFIRRYSPSCAKCDKHTIPPEVQDAMDPLAVVAGYAGGAIQDARYVRKSRASELALRGLTSDLVDEVRIWNKGAEPQEATDLL